MTQPKRSPENLARFSLTNNAAEMYTLIVTAKLNDIDPQAWFADVLARVAELPHTRVHELLPWNWKGARHQPLAA